MVHASAVSSTPFPSPELDSHRSFGSAPSGDRYPLSIAPMMDRTDRHFRYFLRQITRCTLLYTEMVTTAAILHGDRAHLLGFTLEEKPLALQLGGSDPQELAACARIAEDFGYDEVNLNVGCPSSRVQEGSFGACLMLDPQRVAACVSAMSSATRLPVTVKHRIGVDERDRYEDMVTFVEVVAAAGCQRFTVHARKAWLQGLSPRENRDIPPLRYEDVYRLKRDLPHLTIEINGGITSLEQVQDHLHGVDAAMIGRAAYDNPYLFAEADRRFFGKPEAALSRDRVVESMQPYIDRWIANGLKLNRLTQPMLQLYAGQPGSRIWKRILTEESIHPGAGFNVLQTALQEVQRLRSEIVPLIP